ncbi:uncharacterized protein LY89DRAFT_731026 [Mollisia scopiformis]|uniref:Methyltransferase domain-containing protein n=1 Tax=Mollisia scopiformis TaxID=149040 RepID=A0A194XI07_MOLSC|nr:uncharacterized protein LY89DRAFT_731026 [Mollisia scopiformis]KUJ19771.1 hypothetical protein LY89DRAFT_731026 [Mollisia scopiformis]
MSESIAERRKMPILFTSLDGEVFELAPEDLPRSSSLHPDNVAATMNDNPVQPTTTQHIGIPIRTLDGPSERMTMPSRIPDSPRSPRTPRSRCGTPLIEVIAPDQLPVRPAQTSSRKEGPHKHHTRSDSNTIKHNSSGVKVPMQYNTYGELIPQSSVNEHPISDQLTVTQLLRVIRKAYHHDLRTSLSKLLNPNPNGGDSVLVEDNIWSHRLSSWDLRLRTPKSASPSSVTSQNAPVYGQRRVLEIGCSDGDWCFAFKKQQPDWVVHGVDDTDHWSCFDRGVPLRDFMRKIESTGGMSSDYFSGATSNIPFPEFTERNLNCLLRTEEPVPCNFYEFIRGRGIFDRVESYKMFLEDVRCLLKPDGVVEFIEVDPRPRISRVKSNLEDMDVTAPSGKKGKKRSCAATDWTSNIEDRFKDPLDKELATDVPGWSRLVEERMKANLRPRDGVAAANLKSWLEGAGFWDVKEFVLPIPVGGTTKSGTLLKEYILYQLELENCIPKLRDELPEVEVADLEHGKYHLNVHIITGRKPMDLRPGDLMANGERREMTSSTYDAMAKFDAIKSSQWKRFDLEGNLAGIMQNLTTLTGAPEALQVTRGTAEDGLMPLIGRHPDLANPFNCPPFVTLKEMEQHISESGGEHDARSQSGRTGLPRLG